MLFIAETQTITPAAVQSDKKESNVERASLFNTTMRAGPEYTRGPCKRTFPYRVDIVSDEEGGDTELQHANAKGWMPFRCETIGDGFSKDSYVFIETVDENQSKRSRQTFPVSKFPKFLGKFLGANPELTGKIIENFVKTMNEYTIELNK